MSEKFQEVKALWQKEVRINGSFRKDIPSRKTIFNPDILFLILDKLVYLIVLGWKEKLSQKYSTVCNLEIKETKNVFKNINYYLPRLVIVIGKNELEANKILVKDCQKKQEVEVNKKELVNWIYNYF